MLVIRGCLRVVSVVCVVSGRAAEVRVAEDAFETIGHEGWTL